MPAAERPVRRGPVAQGRRSSSTASACPPRSTTVPSLRGVHRAASPRWSSSRRRRGPTRLRCPTQIVEQVIRPTGLVDPRRRDRADARTRSTTCARALDVVVDARRPRAGHDAHQEDGRGPHRASSPRPGYRVQYLHSDIDTIQRIEILRSLRLGEFDVLVGINLLREGLDLPEVSPRRDPRRRQGGLPALAQSSLIQTIGRAARNSNGEAVLYADRITDSMRAAMSLDRAASDGSSSPTTPSTASTRRRSSRPWRTSWGACAASQPGREPAQRSTAVTLARGAAASDDLDARDRPGRAGDAGRGRGAALRGGGRAARHAPRVRSAAPGPERPATNWLTSLTGRFPPMSSTIRVQGARVHNLKNLSRRDPARPAGGLHRAVGLGQVVAGLRHDLRRGPAPLRREPVGLRPPVPRPDGQARRRLHRGALARRSPSTRRPRRATRARPSGTITEIHDYLRLLFARDRACPTAPTAASRSRARRPSRSSTRCSARPTASGSSCWRPSSRAARGSTARCSTTWRRQGYSRVRVDGDVIELADREALNLARYEQHTIDVVLDRLERALRRTASASPSRSRRRCKLTQAGRRPFLFDRDATELGLVLRAAGLRGLRDQLRRARPARLLLQLALRRVPGVHGARHALRGRRASSSCPTATLSLSEGALAPVGRGALQVLRRGSSAAIAELGGFDVDTPWKKLAGQGPQARPLRGREALGAGQVPQPLRQGAHLRGHLRGHRRLAGAQAQRGRRRTGRASRPSSTCARSSARRAAASASSPRSLAVTVARPLHRRGLGADHRRGVDALLHAQADRARGDHRAPAWSRRSSSGSQFLMDVGLDYLTLSARVGDPVGRRGPAHPPGQPDRVSYLVGVLYVLDEPSIGLHQRDNQRLIATLERLRDLGQLGHRRRARRGDHPLRRLHRRHRARRRGVRRPGRARRPLRGRLHRANTRVAHRRSTSPGAASIPVPADAPRRRRQASSRSSARAPTTSRTSTCRLPPRAASSR